MAKPPRVRDPLNANDGTGDPRHDWRTPWKKWAVAQLPSTASRAVKVEVRASVERALGRFRPDADEDELRNVVMTVVEDAVGNITADADRADQKAAKRMLLSHAGLYLQAALIRLKARGALVMLKRPGYSFRRLEQRLQKRLQRELTGGETPQDVQARVEAWVEARLAEQPAPSHISSATLAAGGAVILAATVAASQHPTVRATAAQALQKGRELLTKLRTPPASPSAGPPPSGVTPQLCLVLTKRRPGFRESCATCAKSGDRA